MGRRLAPLALLVLAPLAAAQTDLGNLPQWHPLRAGRVAEEREEPPASMSESFYRRLSRTHELLDEDNLTEALDLMDRIRTDRLSDYEAAQLYQTYGFVYSQMEREGDAFEAFERCLELDALPTMVQQGIVYSVAGYYSGEERFRESNDTLMRWFRYEAEPRSEAYILMGANFAQQEMMPDALPYVIRANELAETPNESWRNLQLAIHVELRQVPEAIELLKENIGIWPDKLRFYQVLSGLYMETNNDEGALSALTIPWHRGMLEVESDILSLARLNLFLENPARAGEILSQAMERGHVEENFDNLRLLLNSWTMAREMNRAVNAIDKLAELADDGEFFHRKAMLLNETGDWDGVVDSCARALEKGGLENPGEVWILQGVALAELRRFDEAIEAFESAKRDGSDNIRRNANAWIGYVRDRTGDSSS
ncbi:MAG: tetratricopeptide repeat protein [Gammaproteobacteria bacterium]|nr:tetratricopeptide repeat protein [Gammaproteobacteria bacterium]MXW44607.1 tetratricopeptide repeat protein [Gammaproteobacteria bacterium]MYD02304.1 tetratricopeptide repeat protein [Gammaproteobacteria bacterium]MYI24768.1 tetratricopeptide repeat protein [Gammaproteobacteria bacterium]